MIEFIIVSLVAVWVVNDKNTEITKLDTKNWKLKNEIERLKAKYEEREDEKIQK